MTDLSALLKSAEQIVKSNSNLNSSVIQNTKATAALTQAEKESIIQENDLERQSAEYIANLKKVTGNIASLGKTVVSVSSDSFEPLGEVLVTTAGIISEVASYFGPVGKLFGAVTEAAASAGNLMIQQMEKAYKSFEAASASGLVTSFTEFEKSANSMGLTFQDYQAKLTAGSKELAQLGGSAIQGTKMLELLAAGSDSTRRDLQKLGIGTAEVAEFQLSYLYQQQRLSKTRIMINSELVAASEKYVDELDLMAKITGKSRKQLDTGRKARRDNPLFATIVNNGKNIPENIERLEKLADAVSPTLEKALIGIAATGRVTKESQALFVSLGSGDVDPISVVNDLMAGKTTVVGALKTLTGGISKYQKDYGDQLVQIQGQQSDAMTSSYVDLNTFLKQFKNLTEKDYDEYVANQKRVKKDTISTNSELANSKQNMYKSSQMLQNLSVQSDVLAGVMNWASKKMRENLEEVYKLAGVEIPEIVQFKRDLANVTDERKTSQTTLSKLQKQLDNLESNDSQSMGIDSDLEIQVLRKEIEDENKKFDSLTQREKKLDEQLRIEMLKQNSGDDKSVTSSGVGFGGGGGGVESIGGGGGGGGVGSIGGGGGVGSTTNNSRSLVDSTTGNFTDKAASEEDFSGLRLKDKQVNGIPESIAGGPVDKNIVNLAKKIQEKFPDATFTGFNDTHKRGPTSKHSKGLAADFVFGGGFNPTVQQGKEITALLKGMGASYALDEYNNKTANGTGNHMHVETARTGGIFNAENSSAFDSYGDDDAQQSVSKQALNSTVSGLTTPASSKLELDDIYEQVTDKMDKLVSLMKTNTKAQQKYLQSQMDT